MAARRARKRRCFRSTSMLALFRDQHLAVLVRRPGINTITSGTSEGRSDLPAPLAQVGLRYQLGNESDPPFSSFIKMQDKCLECRPTKLASELPHTTKFGCLHEEQGSHLPTYGHPVKQEALLILRKCTWAVPCCLALAWFSPNVPCMWSALARDITGSKTL